jgi:hypothetical protein
MAVADQYDDPCRARPIRFSWILISSPLATRTVRALSMTWPP